MTELSPTTRQPEIRQKTSPTWLENLRNPIDAERKWRIRRVAEKFRASPWPLSRQTPTRAGDRLDIITTDRNAITYLVSTIPEEGRADIICRTLVVRMRWDENGQFGLDATAAYASDIQGNGQGGQLQLGGLNFEEPAQENSQPHHPNTLPPAELLKDLRIARKNLNL